ncbi:MAG TPA: glycosyltransferase [Pirellulaceae bacterium]|nr:glycosyltransferase [Pirellulaceae bacterium]
MIKVVRIIARLNVGGPSIHVTLLNARLNPARYHCTLVTGIENAAEGSMLDYARAQGVNPVVISEIVGEVSLRPRDVKAVLRLYALLRQERPDIVHTHTAKAGFVGRIAAWLAGAPLIVHTYHGHVLHGYYSPTKTRLLRVMERALGMLSDRIVAVSDEIKADLVRYGVAKADKISVIPLGFDLSPFLSSAVLRGKFRAELGCDETTRLVGIVGRIFPIKNHRLFLDGARRIIAREPDCRFVVVGDGALRRQTEEYASHLGIADRVIFTGWRRDLPRIYADLDALVVSSDNEGTPVAAIEAMAAAKPVVATRVGGLPDLIVDGKTGLLIPPRDPEALASSVLQVLQEKERARRIGLAAQLFVRERFAASRLVGDMDLMYQDLLSRREKAGAPRRAEAAKSAT